MMEKIGISEEVKNVFFTNLGMQVIELQNAMEVNAFDTAMQIARRIRNSAMAFEIKDLSDACQWIEDVCIQKSANQLLHSYQVIEVIASRYINLPKLRCAA